MSALIAILALGGLCLFIMLLPLWQRGSDRSLGNGIETNDLSQQWEIEKDRLVKEQNDLDIALAEGKITEKIHKVEREQVMEDAKRALNKLRQARNMSERLASNATHKPKVYPRYGMGLAATIFLATGALIVHLNGHDIQRQLSRQEMAKNVTMPQIKEMVAGLEKRVAEGGGTHKEKMMLARSFLVVGRRDESIALYKKLSAEKKDDVGALMALGEIHFNSKSKEEQSQALSFFEKVLAVEPDKPEALWYKSLALIRDRKIDESRIVLARLKDVAKDNKKAQDAVSRLLAELDKNRAKPKE